MSDTQSNNVILNKVHLKGFKSIEDLSVELSEGLNVLIGKNGSGKSNFLEFLKNAIPIRYTSKGFDSCVLEYITGEDEFSILIEKENTREKHKSKVKLENDFIAKVLQNGVVLFDSSLGNIGEHTDVLFTDFIQKIIGKRTLYKPMDGYTYLSFELKSLLIGFGVPENINFVSVPGQIKLSENFDWEFGDTLSFIDDTLFDLEIDSNPEDFRIDKASSTIMDNFKISDDIIENLSRYSPIKNIRLNESFAVYTSDRNLIIDNLRFDFFINDSWVPWSYLSDGTKRLFYIITEVTNKYKGLILIEEPELGIHPHQFQLLMTFLKEQAEDKQIIISTHSPKALDIFNPDELDHIMIAAYEKDKGTQIYKLTADQKEKANDYMQDVGFLSDYWLMSDLEA